MQNSRLRRLWIGALLAASMAAVVRAEVTTTLTVDAGKPGIAISPTLYGLMTEEINHAYDGGLYAELIRNRTFQDDPQGPKFWTAVGGGTVEMTRDTPVSAALPVSLKLNLNGRISGVANDGFWGIPVKPDTTYTVSFYAKGGDGYAGPVSASIVGENEQPLYAKADVDAVTGEWKKYTLTLKTAADVTPTKAAKFVLGAAGAGSVCFSHVSLFPPTYDNRPNGLRPDLVKLMQAMRPAFLRFPGGNYLEGMTPESRFDWKRQIGPADQRPGHMGTWNYRSSDGLGLPEFLHWCRAINAEPVLGVYAGYSLRGQSAKAGPELQKYVDEALEEIEYVTGGPDTKWGARRIADGNAEPFKLRFVEVGNEDWLDKAKTYDGRFAQFYDAIKAKYPDIQVIATIPVKGRTPDVLDDHFYRSPRALARDIGHYDKADRRGPKVFVGEWASQSGRPTPDLHAALGDAAWLLGLERNSDLVTMSCYAPLFTNVNPGAWQWKTNLIGYDALTSFGSPSYYAQVMLAENKGDVVLPVEVKTDGATAVSADHGAVGVGTWRTAAEFKDLAVTTPDGKAFPLVTGNKIDGGRIGHGQWTVKDGVLTQASPDQGCVVRAGDPNWTDYAFSVKARKTGGDEGFLVSFRAADDANYVWWNVGGWDNARTAMEATTDGERQQVGESTPMKVETGRWYDLRVEVSGRQAKGFVDGKLVSEATLPDTAAAPVYAGASRDRSAGEVIVKVVNMTNDAVAADVKLDGVNDVAAAGRAFVLTGDALNAVNTAAEPTKVVPKQETVTDAGPAFKRTFPPRSFTILRLKAASAR